MDLAKYAALFLAESREHLNTCNQMLLEWERTPESRSPVGGLFRAVHTIKGMAATMGYAGVADLAHRLESLLDALRGGRVAVDPAVFQLLFRSVDALGAGVDAAAAGGDAAADTALLADLDRVAGGAGSVAEPVGRAERARMRGVEITLRREAVMRGARASLILSRLEPLGAVSALRPPAASFERDEFDGQFAFRLTTEVADGDIERIIRRSGEVALVRIGDPIEENGEGAGRGRQIRVDLVRLDALMKQVGELVVAKNRLAAIAAASGEAELDEVSDRVGRLVAGMQAEVLAARMTPVGEVFERFPRLVRDLARDLNKRIRFEAEGEEIELDRSVLDEIGEPLLHLIRNAADHGIERPDARAAAGKPEEGRILLSAARERNTVALRVIDDGRGIDREAILAKARREGLADATTDTLTDDLLLRVLARPGFSTAAAVSGVSGRGVGVDVAMTRVRALGGTLEVRSELGRGTTFTVRVPLTLAIVRALLARAGNERYAVPLAYVAETVEFDPRAVTSLRDREALLVRDRVVPTIHLRHLVRGEVGGAAARAPTVILELGDRRTALVVDALAGQQDIVVEPFDAPRGMPPFVGGATILADGAPALILDAAALL
jgi:two-component system, chemotaxis family, sensor kinase CheA